MAYPEIAEEPAKDVEEQQSLLNVRKEDPPRPARRRLGDLKLKFGSSRKNVSK